MAVIQKFTLQTADFVSKMTEKFFWKFTKKIKILNQIQIFFALPKNYFIFPGWVFLFFRGGGGDIYGGRGGEVIFMGGGHILPN